MSAVSISASVPVITHLCANVGTVPKVPLNNETSNRRLLQVIFGRSDWVCGRCRVQGFITSFYDIL